ncbi:MAG: toxin-antitoxin system YwqK family antitoxin [Flavobacteriales bacterium]
MQARNVLLRFIPICQAALFAFAAQAQGPSRNQAFSLYGTVVYEDEVDADYSTVSVKKTDYPLTRTVKVGHHEHYDVVVTDPYGIPRMKGSYRDRALEIPDGLFLYYFANGQLESKGQFFDGAKVGVWQCWESDGASRPERIYRGNDLERLQVALGLSEQAPTLGRSHAEGKNGETGP